MFNYMYQYVKYLDGPFEWGPSGPFGGGSFAPPLFILLPLGNLLGPSGGEPSPPLSPLPPFWAPLGPLHIGANRWCWFVQVHVSICQINRSTICQSFAGAESLSPTARKIAGSEKSSEKYCYKRVSRRRREKCRRQRENQRYFERDIARYLARYLAAFLARGEKTSDNIAAIYRWKYRWKYRSCVAWFRPVVMP